MKVRSTKREQPPVGVHIARVVGITDLGHQPGFTWSGGEAESSYKYEITYELVKTEMEDGRPFWVSEEVNNTDNKDGFLSVRVNATGVTFKTVDQMIDKPCMVTVGRNKNDYAKVEGVSGVPEGIDVRELSNPTVVFDIYAEVPDLETFRSFSEFKQNKIISALDFKDTNLYKALSANGEIESEDSPF